MSENGRLIGAVGLAGVLALAACSAPTPTEPPAIYYDGPLNESIKGYPELTEKEINKMIQQLRSTELPILVKAADIASTMQESDNPPDFPKLINEASTPLAVVREPAGTKIAQTYYDRHFEDKDGFIAIYPGGLQDKRQFIKPPTFGIGLMDEEEFDRYPMERAMFFAQVTLTLALSVKIGEDLASTGALQVEDLDGQPLNTSEKIHDASLSVALAQKQDPNNKLWRFIDLAPLVLVAPSVGELINRGDLPINSQTMGNFYKAANFVESQPELMQKVRSITDTWASSPRVTGPDDFSKTLTTNDMVSAVNALAPMIFPDPGPTANL